MCFGELQIEQGKCKKYASEKETERVEESTECTIREQAPVGAAPGVHWGGHVHLAFMRIDFLIRLKLDFH